MRWIFVVLFSTAMLLLPAAAKHLTQGFRVIKMKVDYPFNSDWQTNPDDAVYAILNQPFHYLGKGAQSYVFESQDKQYVIKLFRFTQPSKKKRVERLFNACKIAFDEMREETGLVFVHLNKTEDHLPVLHCKDPIGRSYRFHLDKMRFALQKKVQLMGDALECAKDNPNQLKQRIDAYFALLKKRLDHQILNTDSNLTRNFGILDDRAIEIDFGSYKRESLDIEQESLRMRRWLKKHAPEWVAYCDEKSKAMAS